MANYGGLGSWGGDPSAGMRASDADRERAIDVLKAGFSEGRLGREEYEQRVELAYRARTYGELTAVVADLPQGPVPMQMRAPQAMPMAPMMPVVPTFLPAPQKPSNGLAVASLLCGIAGTILVVPTVAAVVLGHRARGQIRRSGETGEAAATTGAVLGYLGLIFWTLVLVLTLSS